MADLLFSTFPWWFLTLSHLLAVLIGWWLRDLQRGRNGGNGTHGEREERPNVRAAL